MHYDVTIANGRFITIEDDDETLWYWHDPSEQVAIMQYTGLNDRNGVEIYEGDYITILDDNNRHYGQGPISFHKGGYQCHDMHLQDIYYENCIVEVIGNIYENPDLLNK